MDLKAYIDKIESNKFDFDLRMNLSFNDDEYHQLVNILIDLEKEMKNHDDIPINLALGLYWLPYIVRNTLDFLKINKPDSDLTQKLEDAWIDIDNLVLNCLSVNQ